ncbi:FAD-dependent oxidoreductase [Streptomyces sp. NPDC000594]|uniref:NAD(P)/FAD-dependent oxidoreductase n=1 Tax=Streptomyces sp. NPDC000594 TaxID=3154261 RepID=UPI003322EB45
MNTTPQRTQRHIIVLGAGYGGLLAALRLAPHTRVTLIDPADHFTERVRLHERATRPTTVTHPLGALLKGTGIRHVARRATALDPTARQVTTDDGEHHGYDRLIYALGSRTPDIPGENVYTAESADALRKRLQDRPGTLAVVGGGLTGIEIAAEIAESHPDWRVRLHSTTPIGADHSPRARDHLHTALSRLGVRTEEGRVTGPDSLDSDAVVWAAGMVPNTALAASAGLTLDPHTSRVAVDATLRSLSHPDIYAVGDAAAAHSGPAGEIRMGCAGALPTGSHAASAILAEGRGHQPPPLDFAFVMRCVSLGRQDGLIQFVRADDTPRDRILTGRAAARTKEQIVRHTVRVLRLARHTPGAVTLLPGLG